MTAGTAPGGGRAGVRAAWVGLALLAAAFCCSEIYSIDLGYYVAKGRVTLEQGTIPHTGDLLCVDFETTLSWSEKWLFQVVVAWLDGHWGHPGLLALRLLLQLALFLAVARAAARAIGPARDLLVPASLALGLLAGRERIDLRPELVCYAGLAIQFWALERHRLDRSPVIWLCPLVQLVTANCHAYFIYGLALIGVYVLSEGAAAHRAHGWRRPPATELRPLRTLIACLALGIAASLLNPRGIGAFAYPILFAERLRELPWYATSVTEFLSPFARLDFPAHAVTAAHVLAPLAVAAVLLNARHGPPAHALLLAATLVNAGQMRRNLTLFALFAAPVLALQGGEVLDRAARRWGSAPSPSGWRRAQPVAVGLLITACLLCAVAAATDRYYVSERAPIRTGLGLHRDLFPAAAVDFLDHAGITGNVFTTFEAGSYVLWRSFPHRRPFIDSESDASYSTGFYRRYLDILHGNRPYADDIDIHHLDYALITHRPSPSRRLLGRMARDPEWALVYWDDVAAVLVRRHGRLAATAARLEVRLVDVAPVAPPAPPPAGWRVGPAFDAAETHFRLGRFLGVVGLPNREEAGYRAALAAWPDYPEVEDCLALALYNRGRADEAIVVLRAAVARHASFPDLQHDLGMILLRRGRRDEALPHLRAARALDPAVAEFARDLGAACAAAGLRDEAEEAFRSLPEGSQR